LSDSTVSRNFGAALAYSLLAYKSTLKGLGKIHADLDYIPSEVKKHPEVLTEAIQTIMRAEDVPEGYEKMKELSRGKKITDEDLKNFVKSLPLNDDVKERLSISPLEYIGNAVKLTHLAVDAIRNDKEINYK
jgi:adenylosuccinate lyase